MRKNINSEKIIGRVYQHNLAIKKVQNQQSENFGKDFISGTLDVATDEDGLNVLTIHYTYVTPTTKAGKTNNTYKTLEKIINGTPTWLSDGKDAATKIKVDTALALNDFYVQDQLVSVKKNEGGFITIINELPEEAERNTFSADMVITNVLRVEADEERGIIEHVKLKGAIFNFRNDILPIEFVVKNNDGMNYFESLEITPSSPVYTKVWGKITSTTVKTSEQVESAWGEPAVSTSERNIKEWVVTGTAKEPYEFGEENVLTVEELTKAMQNREILLADIKKKNEEYQASKNSGGISSSAAINTGTFNF